MPAHKNRRLQDRAGDADQDDEMDGDSETARGVSDEEMQTATPEKERRAGEGIAAEDEYEDQEEAEQRRKAQEAVKAKLAARQQKTHNRLVSGAKGKNKGKDIQTQTISTSLEDKERKPGDIWENAQGDLFRLDEDGKTRKKVEIYEERLKYRMPKDSKHPDRNTKEYVLTSQWLTKEEWEDASSKLLLREQAREREERDRPRAPDVDEDIEMVEATKVGRAVYHLVDGLLCCATHVVLHTGIDSQRPLLRQRIWASAARRSQLYRLFPAPLTNFQPERPYKASLSHLHW